MLLNKSNNGLIDLVIEDTLKVHDYMALIPVIQGSGGIISDRYGKKISLKFLSALFKMILAFNIHEIILLLAIELLHIVFL